MGLGGRWAWQRAPRGCGGRASPSSPQELRRLNQTEALDRLGTRQKGAQPHRTRMDSAMVMKNSISLRARSASNQKLQEQPVHTRPAIPRPPSNFYDHVRGLLLLEILQILRVLQNEYGTVDQGNQLQIILSHQVQKDGNSGRILTHSSCRNTLLLENQCPYHASQYYFQGCYHLRKIMAPRQIQG